MPIAEYLNQKMDGLEVQCWKGDFAVPLAHMKLHEDRFADYPTLKNEAIWGRKTEFVGTRKKLGKSLTRDPSV